MMARNLTLRLFRVPFSHTTTKRNQSSLVTYETLSNGHVGCITLNNPDKMNALTEDMGDALHTVIDNVSDEVRAIIITGSGLYYVSF